MDARIQRLAWPALYAAVALVVAGPLLAPGFVFALDHAMGPQSAAFYAGSIAHNSDAIQSKGGYALLLLALDAVFPVWFAQKLILFVPFFLAGYGAHRLVAGNVSTPAAVFAGLFYALSPFAYLRGISGQTGVLWAYALAPWFLRAWLDHLATGSRRALLVAALLVALTLVFQAHGVILLAILVGVMTLVALARSPRTWRASLRSPMMLAAWSLALNLAWLLPVVLARETTLSGIGAGDRAFFATTDAGLPSVGLAALTLQGFWREAYASPYAFRALLVIPAVVLLLSVRGLLLRSDDAARGIALAGALGLVLAIGSSSRATAWFTDAVWDHVPLMRGFREPHKFLALLALAYVYLAPFGFDALIGAVRAMRVPRAAPALLIAVLLAAPVAAATPLLGGYRGQLGVVDYPAEWAEVEAVTRDCDGAMVVLPWHLYADQSWIPNADKRVTNPAKLYFSCPTFTSDDLELGAAASQASAPAVRYVAHWVGEGGVLESDTRSVNVLGNLLSPVGARFVLLLKEADWASVAPALDAQEDLRLVLDNGRARLYENEAKVAPRLHGVAEVVPIAGFDDLVAIANERPLADIAFVVGEAPVAAGVAFTPSPRVPLTRWALDAEKPVAMSLGFQPIFSASSTEGRVRDVTAWSIGAFAWGVSSAATLAAFALAWREPTRRAR